MSDTPTEQPDWMEAFKRVCEQLPEKVDITPDQFYAKERTQRFLKICPDEFKGKINRALLPKPEEFDKVALWDGTYPGPIAHGGTGTAKTRAAWSALAHLFIEKSKPFAWFTAHRLIGEIHKHSNHGDSDEFFRIYSHFPVLMVDDLDKISSDFESRTELIWTFYDWVYRQRRPVITTTNKSRQWWETKMGDAFARRLFGDAHFEVKF